MQVAEKAALLMRISPLGPPQPELQNELPAPEPAITCPPTSVRGFAASGTCLGCASPTVCDAAFGEARVTPLAVAALEPAVVIQGTTLISVTRLSISLPT